MSTAPDYQIILNQIQREFADLPLWSKVASYIPELAGALSHLKAITQTE